MMHAFKNTAGAELIKLRGLPAIFMTVLATVGAAIVLAGAVAASTAAPSSALQVTSVTIPFLQIGTILIGILTVAHEYAGGQIRSTLTATPNRTLLLTGKAIAYLATTAVASVGAVGAGFATASIILAARDVAPVSHLNGWLVAGAAVYLVFIGLLAFALTVLLRSLIPPLISMLGLVLIASPLLSGFTEHARWLPDQAGALLYRSDTDPILTAGTGMLVLLAWIAASAAVAGVAFGTRDA